MNDFDTHQGMDGQQVTTYQPGRPSPTREQSQRVTIGNIQGTTTWRNTPDSFGDGLGTPNSLNGGSRSNGGVDQGVIRFQAGQQVQQGAPVSRITAADLAPTQGGILGTLQNSAGFPTGTAGPNATVELPGMGRTSVKVAANLGYLTRTADGRYVEVGEQRGNVEGGLSAEVSQQPATQQQPAALEGMDLFNSQTSQGETLEAVYSEMIAPLEQGTYDSMLAGASVMIGQGADLDSIISALEARHGSDIVSQMPNPPDDLAGNEKERVSAYIRAGAGMWQHQADSHLQGLGIDPADFYEWAKESRPREIRQALQGHLFGRSLKGYTDLADAYFDSVPPTMEALAKGGVPTRTEGGTVMVQLQGCWMSLNSAVKARLI